MRSKAKFKVGDLVVLNLLPMDLAAEELGLSPARIEQLHGKMAKISSSLPAKPGASRLYVVHPVTEHPSAYGLAIAEKYLMTAKEWTAAQPPDNPNLTWLAEAGEIVKLVSVDEVKILNKVRDRVCNGSSMDLPIHKLRVVHTVDGAFTTCLILHTEIGVIGWGVTKKCYKDKINPGFAENLSFARAARPAVERMQTVSGKK